MDFSKYSLFKQTQTTYLKEIFKEDGEITLVHSKHCEAINETMDIERELVVEKPNEETLELTGNPLEVDLNGDNDLDVSSTVVARPNNWSLDEEGHYPMALDTARDLLNIVNKRQASMGNGENVLAANMYCICDGKDTKKTVIMGCNPFTFTRTVVQIKNCIHSTHIEEQIPKMKEKHTKNVGEILVPTTVCSTVNRLVGVNIRNFKGGPAPADCSGSAFIESTWGMPTFEPMPNETNSVKLMLQIFAGHPTSTIHPLWEQLCDLHAFIAMYSGDYDEEDTPRICQTQMSLSDMNESVLQLMSKTARKQRIAKLDIHKIDMNNVRDADFLDELWKILIHFEDTEDIRECFTALFEEYAQHPPKSNRISEENTTLVANILRGIKSGTFAVPTISSQQALMFLIEIGLEKLKNDYLYVMNCFSFLDVEKIIERWSKFTEEKLGAGNRIDTRMTLSAAQMGASRRTRKTIQPRSFACDSSTVVQQLNFLATLHVGVQFAYLADNCKFPERDFVHVCSRFFEDCEERQVEFKTLLTERLCEFDVHMPDFDNDFLRKFPMVSWNMKLNSRYGRHVTTTVFHYTESPIFPKTIFNEYDIPITESNDCMYYASEGIIWEN